MYTLLIIGTLADSFFISKEVTCDSTRSVKNTKFYNLEKSFSQYLGNRQRQLLLDDPALYVTV